MRCDTQGWHKGRLRLTRPRARRCCAVCQQRYGERCPRARGRVQTTYSDDRITQSVIDVPVGAAGAIRRVRGQSGVPDLSGSAYVSFDVDGVVDRVEGSPVGEIDDVGRRIVRVLKVGEEHIDGRWIRRRVTTRERVIG